jgi:hypothetical protein
MSTAFVGHLDATRSGGGGGRFDVVLLKLRDILK